MARGRPSKLTEEIREAVCEHLRSGLHRKTAASLVRIDETTFSRWYQMGAREERGKHRDFHLAVNEAEAEFEQRTVSKILATGEPRWLVWHLSRLAPVRYGRRDNVAELGSNAGTANTQELRELLLSRLERMAATPVAESQSEPQPEVEAAPPAEESAGEG